MLHAGFGDELILLEMFGAIQDRGVGLFIAGITDTASANGKEIPNGFRVINRIP
jgi:hypothetical protein